MTATRRLPVSDAELAVIAEALREALAAELLSPGSQRTARELLDRVDAKLPRRAGPASRRRQHGPAAGGR